MKNESWQKQKLKYIEWRVEVAMFGCDPQSRIDEESGRGLLGHSFCQLWKLTSVGWDLSPTKGICSMPPGKVGGGNEHSEDPRPASGLPALVRVGGWGTGIPRVEKGLPSSVAGLWELGVGVGG